MVYLWVVMSLVAVVPGAVLTGAVDTTGGYG